MKNDSNEKKQNYNHPWFWLVPSPLANYANSSDIFTKITTEILKIISKTYFLHFLCTVT